MAVRSILRLPVSGLLLLGGLSVAVVVPSCSDPVHDQQVAALGPENPQVPRGQYHRAGQPCTVCHGPEGPAQTTFSVAGTIFWQPNATPNGLNQGALGANVATIGIVDDLGTIFQVVTNCVGNFWITPGAYNPAFPILVNVTAPVTAGGVPPQTMFTHISRAGSCAECHRDPANYNAVGHVYIVPSGPIPAGQNNVACPVDPNLADYGAGP